MFGFNWVVVCAFGSIRANGSVAFVHVVLNRLRYVGRFGVPCLCVLSVLVVVIVIVVHCNAIDDRWCDCWLT